MGKQSSKALKPAEILEMARQQNYMSNPNVSNIFGSTNTTFDANDQAQIVQELSPEMQGLIGQQMDFVGNGPAQMGEYSNPLIQGLMQNTIGSLGRTGGWGGNLPDASQMGGYTQPSYGGANAINVDGPMPAEMQPALPEVPQQPNPNLSMGYDGQNKPMAQEDPKSSQLQGLAQALSQMGGGQAPMGGGQSPYTQLGQGIATQFNRLKNPNDNLAG